jgi:phosphoribosylformylglycinamidine cyclo-ligase
VPNVFQTLARGGHVSREEMFRAFNMGVGMVVLCAPDSQGDVIATARACSISAWACGEIRPGAGQVTLT